MDNIVVLISYHRLFSSNGTLGRKRVLTDKNRKAALQK